MNAEQAPRDQPKVPTSGQAESVRADDALVDRLSAGRWDRRDRRDPAAAVLAAMLAELDDRPDPRVVSRSHARRVAIAAPVIAGLLVMPGLAAAASVGDPWAPYRSALVPFGLSQAQPDDGLSPAAVAALRALRKAEAEVAAGDLAGARRLVAAAIASLPGAAEQEAAGLLGRLRALERILAADANGRPGGPAATQSPAPNGNANGQDETKQTSPPTEEPPVAGDANGAGTGTPTTADKPSSGVNGAGNGGPAPAATPAPAPGANGSGVAKATGKPAG